MREKEAYAVLQLLRARTIAQRAEAIRHLRAYATKLPFFGTELATLQGEAEMAVEAKTVLPAAALYITADPTLRNDRLRRVEPGPDTVLLPGAATLINEWVTGWQHARELAEAGVPAPGPLLLHGPPGSGKTATTKMISRQFDGVRTVVSLEAMAVTDQYMGQTTAHILKACEDARKAGAIIVIEESDTLTSQRLYEQGSEVENARVTTAVMRIIEQPGPTILTTNRLDVLDSAVRRRCEFIVEFYDATPDTRCQIIARELGAPSVASVPLSLIEAMPLARRARRRSVLESTSATTLFDQMVEAVRGQRGDDEESPF